MGHPPVYIEAYFINLVSRVLVNYALGPFPERPDGGVVPPLHHITILVELAAFEKKLLIMEEKATEFTFIVETVGDLVADNHANTAVIQRLGEVLAVEKRLQNARRKHYETKTVKTPLREMEWSYSPMSFLLGL